MSHQRPARPSTSVRLLRNIPMQIGLEHTEHEYRYASSHMGYRYNYLNHSDTCQWQSALFCLTFAYVNLLLDPIIINRTNPKVVRDIANAVSCERDAFNLWFLFRLPAFSSIRPRRRRMRNDVKNGEKNVSILPNRTYIDGGNLMRFRCHHHRRRRFRRHHRCVKVHIRRYY